MTKFGLLIGSASIFARITKGPQLRRFNSHRSQLMWLNLSRGFATKNKNKSEGLSQHTSVNFVLYCF